MSAVDVVGLTKGFGGRPVLDGLDLAVQEGSLTAVLGPSGSGKTTLLRLLAGFERADAGSISIGSEVVDGGDGRRFVAPKHRHIGYVSQEGALFPHLTVAKNIGFGIRRGPDRSRRIAELVQLVGLSGLDDRFPHQLSGGQQQRVALARALAVGPSLVLFDEPFTSLDARLRSSLRADVKRILTETGTTAVLVTHDQDEALSWADVVAVMHDGRIGERASPEELYTRPGTLTTAHFFGVANLVDGVAEGTSVSTGFGRLLLIPGSAPFSDPTPVVVLVRPEQVLVSPGQGIDDGPRVGSEPSEGLDGLVLDIQFYGHDYEIVVAVDPSTGTDTVIARTPGVLAPSVGSTVTLSVKGPVHSWVDVATRS